MLNTFDAALKDAYLVQAVKKIGSTLNDAEKIQLLVSKYGVTVSKAQKAVLYCKK